MSGEAASIEVADTERLHSLAGYQSLARDALRDAVKHIAGLQATEPTKREADRA